MDDGFPVFWRSARGAIVTDADGNDLIDFTSAFGVAALGHSDPGIAGAVSEAAGTLPHGMGDVHPPEIKVRLLEKLASIFPGGGAKGILSLSGSEAVESMMKTACVATGRPGIIAFDGAYHGLSYGAMLLTSRPFFRERFIGQTGEMVRRVPYPSDGITPDESIEAVRAALTRGDVGLVIVEPVQGRGGVRIPPEGFLSALLEVTHEGGAILGLDEIMTGFGRTGFRWGADRDGILPDIISTGKALGNGVPISASLSRSEIMDAWPRSEGEAIHTSTFLGHPLGCAAALEFLARFEAEDLPGKAVLVGRRIEEALSGPAEKAGLELRGIGAIWGLAAPSAAIATRIARRSLERGLILLVNGDESDVVTLLPPLLIGEEDLSRGLDILISAIE